MKTIQVRNVPDEVHRTLRTRAAADGVSLSNYALRELERLAARPPIVDVLLRAQSRPGGARSADVMAALEADRRERE